MKYTATILVTDQELYECVKPDESDDKRHKTIVEKTPEGIKITIKTEDAVALRAILTSFTRQLAVAESLKKV